MATLINDLKTLFLESDSSSTQKALFESFEYQQVIDGRMVNDAEAFMAVLDNAAALQAGIVAVSSKGKGTFAMTDRFDSKKVYGFYPPVAIYGAEGVVVKVSENGLNELTIDEADFTLDEVNFTINFDVARTETTPIVTVQAFIVDYLGVKYDMFTRYLHKLGILPSVRGREFNDLFEKGMRARDELYGGGVIRRASGV